MQVCDIYARSPFVAGHMRCYHTFRPRFKRSRAEQHRFERTCTSFQLHKEALALASQLSNSVVG